MAVQHKRKDLTLEEKVKVIKAYEEPGATQSSDASHFSINKSVVSRLMKKKDNLLLDFSQGKSKASRKRIRHGQEPQIKEALYLWLQQKLTQNARVSGPMLKKKAHSLAALAEKDFSHSDGWLTRWKKRYNIMHFQKRTW